MEHKKYRGNRDQPQGCLTPLLCSRVVSAGARSLQGQGSTMCAHSDRGLHRGSEEVGLVMGSDRELLTDMKTSDILEMSTVFQK